MPLMTPVVLQMFPWYTGCCQIVNQHGDRGGANRSIFQSSSRRWVVEIVCTRVLPSASTHFLWT